MRRASSTCLPRMRSTTRLALNGETLTNFATALASNSSTPLLQRRASLGVVPVGPERPRGSELPELVPHHGLGDEHRHVLAAVVHGDGVADHLGDDRRPPRPGADDPLPAALVHLLDLAEEMVVHERSLLHRSGHQLSPSLASAADDVPVRRLALLPRPAFFLAPRRGGVPAAGRFALASAQRVVHRVHGHPAGGRADPQPPVPAGLPQGDELVLRVAHLAHGGPATEIDPPDLPGRQSELGEAALLGHQLDAGAGRAGHLGPPARAQLHGVHHGTHRDVGQGEGVAGADVRSRTRGYQLTDPQPLGRQDVPLLSVRVVEEGDSGGPVGVVFDRRHLRGDAVLLPAEIDHPVLALVPTPLVARGDPAVDVPPGLLGLGTDQRLLRLLPSELGEVGDAGSAAARGRRLVFPDRHIAYFCSKISMESPGARVTTARFSLARVPSVQRNRLVLPRRLSVLTRSTRTFQIDWTASLISVLLACRLTMNVYRFCSRP